MSIKTEAYDGQRDASRRESALNQCEDSCGCNFGRFITELSRSLIDMSAEEMDGALNDAVRHAGVYCGADWTAIYCGAPGTAESPLFCWQRAGSPGEVPTLPPAVAAASRAKGFGPIGIPGISGGVPLYGCPLDAGGNAFDWLVFGGMSECKEGCAELKDFCAILSAALRRREKEIENERMRLLLDHTDCAIALLDRDGTMLAMSRTFARRLAQPVRELIGREIGSVPNMLPYTLGARRLRAFHEAVSKGKPQRFLDKFVNHWLENRYQPVYRGGKVIGVVYTSADITKSLRSVREYEPKKKYSKDGKLRIQNDQEYLQVFDDVVAGAWIYDFTTNTARFSSQWMERTGASRIPKSGLVEYVLSRIHKEDRGKALHARMSCIEDGRTQYWAEYRLQMIGGDWIWILEQGKIVCGDDGEPRRIYGTLTDITDRKKACEALRENQALLGMIVEALSDHVYLKDTENRMVMANRAITDFLQIPAENILGKTELQYMSDKEQARSVIANDRRIMESGREETVEEKVRDRVFLSKKAPWRDADGNIVGLFGISRDITERIAMNQALRDSAKELERKNQLITDFFINISHEFKTPVSILLIASELVEQCIIQPKPDIESLRANIPYLRQNVMRLGRLVNNLLDITKLDAGFMHPVLVNRDIVGMLRYLVSSLQVCAQQKDVVISYTGMQEEMMMPVDMVMLDRILLNLVSNALKATAPGGHIEVGCEALINRVRIFVSDNGTGIPKDKQKVIFDRFQQANPSLARSGEGCGIGLSLVRLLTQALGGHAWVCSEMGQGSTFFVELPIQEETTPREYSASGLMLDQRIEMELSDIMR